MKLLYKNKLIKQNIDIISNQINFCNIKFITYKISSLNLIEKKHEKKLSKCVSKNIINKNNNYKFNVKSDNNNFYAKIGKSFSEDDKTTLNVELTGESKRSYDMENKGKNKDSNYVPEYMKNYSLKIIDTTEIDNIMHNEEQHGIVYKYGLPEKNITLVAENDPNNKELTDISKNEYGTIMENVMEMFELDKDSSYENLIEKYNGTFNNGKFFNILLI